METQSLTLQRKTQLLPASGNTPGLSIISPFDPKMTSKSDLNERLNQLVKAAQQQMEGKYSRDQVMAIISKAKSIIAGLDFTTYKRSVAIYVSKEVQQVYYLNIDLKEAVIVDGSFRMRDVVYNKDEDKKYLLLLLSGQKVKMYLGGNGKLIKIVSSIAENIEAFRNDNSQKVSNFSDSPNRKETMLNKFLLDTDASIGLLLKAYPLPMFVVGNDRVIGRFKKVSRNLKSVIDYIHADLINASESQIMEAAKPCVRQWAQVKQQYLMGTLEMAAGERKLSFGLVNVWRDATQKRGKLLIVERNYIAPAISKNDTGAKSDGLPNIPKAKDAVEDIIEKVLASGGDVEFVYDGYLASYDRIALILHYQNLWS